MLKIFRGIVPLFVLAPSLAFPVSTAPAGPPPETLGMAMRFATAVVPDEVDRGRAQESVVLDLAQGGFLDEALRLAPAVTGWRRGAALAEVAARLARSGRFAEAQSAVNEARAVESATSGWQKQRIRIRIGAALAAMGQVDQAAIDAAALAREDNQYAGVPEAMSAPLLASRGDTAQALLVLGSLDEAKEIDATLNRTRGYLEVAKLETLDRPTRLEVLARTVRSAGGVPGWAGLAPLAEAARMQAALGEAEAARASLKGTEPVMSALPATLPVRAMLLSRGAVAWKEAGDPARARRLLEDAEKHVPAMAAIDRPAAYASVAAGQALIGRPAEAGRVFRMSLDTAEGLVNARPRALAVVEILREMARAGWEPDAPTKGRLDGLLSGLKAPW